jgi:dolichol-phosphate mannosyltransferase
MLAIVLPAFNEAACIGELLEHIGDAVGPRGPFEILVVDAGSTDGTSAIAARAPASLHVRVLFHCKNRGYGRALRTGLTEAVRSVGAVVTLDADGSHDPSLIPAMLEKIEAGYDLVIASRFRSGGAEIGVPLKRRMLSHSASWLCRTTLAMRDVRDYTSGFRAYRSSLLERMICTHEKGFPRSANFAAGLELLLSAASVGAKIIELPLVLRYDRKRSASKMRLSRDLPSNISLLLRHFFRVRGNASPV